MSRALRTLALASMVGAISHDAVAQGAPASTIIPQRSEYERLVDSAGVSYRAANSRYHPGEERPDWTLVPMPRR